MKATSMCPKTWEELDRACQVAHEITSRYAAMQVSLLSLTLPTIIQTRTETGFTITSSYDPETQKALDSIRGMCRRELESFLRAEGFDIVREP